MADITDYFHPSWVKLIKTELASPQYQSLKLFLRERRKESQVLPDGKDIFKAFQLTAVHDVRVVIIGDEPYRNPDMVTGLAFGGPRTDTPPALSNIMDEVDRHLRWSGKEKIERVNPTLEGWAHQGVLLLNSVLTTEPGLPGAHYDKGWEWLINQILLKLTQQPRPIVFMFWGRMWAYWNETEECKMYKDNPPERLLFLTATNPNPLTFRSGPVIQRFQGCGHFGTANKFLKKHGSDEIDWSNVL